MGGRGGSAPGARSAAGEQRPAEQQEQAGRLRHGRSAGDLAEGDRRERAGHLPVARECTEVEEVDQAVEVEVALFPRAGAAVVRREGLEVGGVDDTVGVGVADERGRGVPGDGVDPRREALERPRLVGSELEGISPGGQGSAAYA